MRHENLDSIEMLFIRGTKVRFIVNHHLFGECDFTKMYTLRGDTVVFNTGAKGWNKAQVFETASKRPQGVMVRTKNLNRPVQGAIVMHRNQTYFTNNYGFAAISFDMGDSLVLEYPGLLAEPIRYTITKQEAGQITIILPLDEIKTCEDIHEKWIISKRTITVLDSQFTLRRKQ